MRRVAHASGPYFSVTNCTIAPLQHDREMTEAGLKLVHRGVPIFVLPMPQAGTTGPMTLLGTCILNMAELLSGVVLYQLAQPGCALISGVGSAVADMRSGGYIAVEPGDRAHQPDLPGDEPLLRAAHPGDRHVGRRQGGQLPGGLRGRHDGADAPRSPAPTR